MKFLVCCINFYRSALPNSRFYASNRFFAYSPISSYFFLLSEVSSTFLPFFSDFSSVFSYLSIILVCLMACVLITGGFFTIYPVSLCLLSISPLKGQESHFPCIFSFAMYIFNSGSLHSKWINYLTWAKDILINELV